MHNYPAHHNLYFTKKKPVVAVDLRNKNKNKFTKNILRSPKPIAH